MSTDRFVNFINENINGRYRNRLIIIDNTGAHRKQEFKDIIRNVFNKLLYTIPYTIPYTSKNKCNRKLGQSVKTLS